MTDQEDRDRESRESDETKFEQLTDETADEQKQVAQRLATDPVVNEPDREEED
jgi:hypothetical protein